MSVVTALSKSFKVVIKRDGKIYQQEYEIGSPLYSVKVIEAFGLLKLKSPRDLGKCLENRAT